MLDRLKYKLFNYLWCIWHIWARRFFDRFAPMCSDCQQEAQTMRELAAEGYPPAMHYGPVRCGHAKYVCDSRPWWHLCCNGDNSGWRTRVCDCLENQWRGTRYYREG